MKKEEYKAHIKKIEVEADQKKRDVIREYALSNNPYKIGDIVEDHYSKICIEKIKVQVSSGNNLPTCVYSGICLKKDGTPFKNGKNDTIYQSNVRTDVSA